MLPFNFNHLYYFYVVAKSGSFSMAARELRISQSAISVQIKQFEQTLGHILFNRIKTGVELTESGQVLFEYAEHTFHDVGGVTAALEAMEHQVKGHVTLGTVNSIGIYTLPDVLKAFNDDYPDVTFAVEFKSSREIVDRIRTGATDFALLTSNRSYEGLKSEPLRKNKMFLVAPPDHPLASQGEVSPRELESHALIGYEEGTETRMLMDALFRRLQLRIEYLIESSNVATIKRLVLAGLGVAMLPETAVAREIRSGHLVRPSVPSLYLFQEITLYYKTNRVLTPTRNAFLNFAKQHIGLERPVKR